MLKTALRIILAAGGLIFAVMVWGLAEQPLKAFGGWVNWKPYRDLILALVYVGTSLALAWLLQVKLDRQPFSQVGFQARWPQALGHLTAGVLMGGAGVALVILAQWGLGAIQLDAFLWEHLDTTRPAWAYVVGGGFSALAVGLSEELFFRGYGLQMARRRHNVVVGLLVASVSFSAIHFIGALYNPMAALNIVLVAVLFSLMVLVHGNLWLAIGFHAAWDWVQWNLLHVVTGPNEKHLGLLMFSPVPGASSLVTGGSYWPEGSYLTTLILGLLTGVYGYQLYRRRRDETEKRLSQSGPPARATSALVQE